MSAVPLPSFPLFTNLQSSGVTVEDLSVWTSQACRKEKKKKLKGWEMDRYKWEAAVFQVIYISSHESSLGEYTSSDISYLWPSAKLLQVILSGIPGDLNPSLCSLNSNGRCLWKGMTSPHFAGLMEFRWKELATYGKPIRDCIRSDLLSPVSVLYFIILNVTCTDTLDGVFSLDV